MLSTEEKKAELREIATVTLDVQKRLNVAIASLKSDQQIVCDTNLSQALLAINNIKKRLEWLM